MRSAGWTSILPFYSRCSCKGEAVCRAGVGDEEEEAVAEGGGCRSTSDEDFRIAFFGLLVLRNDLTNNTAPSLLGGIIRVSDSCCFDGGVSDASEMESEYCVR